MGTERPESSPLQDCPHSAYMQTHNHGNFARLQPCKALPADRGAFLVIVMMIFFSAVLAMTCGVGLGDNFVMRGVRRGCGV